MNRILKWLESKFSRPANNDETNPGPVPARVTESDDVRNEQDDLDHTATHPSLAAIEDVPVVIEEPDDFDPYNSGSFESSKKSSRE